ncbi:MAG: DNA ligase [Ramlibacter sp.]|nr:DNA ligase [Ramlibacter sp.]
MTTSDTGSAACSRRTALGWLVGAGLASPTLPALSAPGAPPLMLARLYAPGVPVADYGVSEKYDGLRGYWDGRQLWTRGGERVVTPAGFTTGWPAQAMDGELWAGRGGFARAVSTARRHEPDAAAWREMTFMVFDLPTQAGSFRERAAALQKLLPAGGAPGGLAAVAHSTVHDADSLDRLMRRTVREGGEGLMLHRWDALYRAGRSPDLLKYKPTQDADARVLGHVPGQGKLAGMLGALLVETPDGVRFRIGTGFSQAQRREPPAVGSWISYHHRGETDRGVPRFASFARVRADLGS